MCKNFTSLVACWVDWLIHKSVGIHLSRMPCSFLLVWTTFWIQNSSVIVGRPRRCLLSNRHRNRHRDLHDKHFVNLEIISQFQTIYYYGFVPELDWCTQVRVTRSTLWLSPVQCNLCQNSSMYGQTQTNPIKSTVVWFLHRDLHHEPASLI